MPPRLTQPTGISVVVHEYDTVTCIGCGGLELYALFSALWHTESVLQGVQDEALLVQGVAVHVDVVIVKFAELRMQLVPDALHDAFVIARTVSL